jgi:predicted TIM-barrel fold metal-dependent hydrolase
MLKRIDAHTHGFATKVAPGSVGVPYEQLELPDQTETLLREMDSHGVERAILHVSHTRKEIEKIQSAVRKYPARFIGFCNWGMGSTGKEAAEFIQKWLREPEFKGVGEALVTNFYSKGKVDTIPEALGELRIAMDVVRKNRVPILFHTGYSGSHTGKFTTTLAWKDPLTLDEIAGEYSDVPIIIGHSGGHYPPYDVNALMMAYQHDNVFLETSKSRTDVIEKAVAEIGSARILFGTDWVREKPHTTGAMSERPGHLYDWNINAIEQAKISDEDKEKIFYRNVQSLLGLNVS